MALLYDELPPIFDAKTGEYLPSPPICPLIYDENGLSSIIFHGITGSNATAPHLFYDSNDENNVSFHFSNDTYGDGYGKDDALEIFYGLCGAKYDPSPPICSIIYNENGPPSLPLSTAVTDEDHHPSILSHSFNGINGQIMALSNSFNIIYGAHIGLLH
eukprot:999831_1